MKRYFFVLLFAAAVPAKAVYFETIFQDPAHAVVGASALFTSKAAFDGAQTSAAIVYHVADPKETLLPQAALDLGVMPISWTLLELGAGGNAKTGFLTGGASVNVAPPLLGPAAAALRHSNNDTAKAFADILVTPDGSGLKLGIAWKANAVQDGTVLPFNRWRFPPRYEVGESYRFGKK